MPADIPLRKTQRQMAKAEQAELVAAELLEPDHLPCAHQMPEFRLLRIAVKELLKGSNAATIREVVKEAGYQVGYNKSYDLIKLAKKHIIYGVFCQARSKIFT